MKNVSLSIFRGNILFFVLSWPVVLSAKKQTTLFSLYPRKDHSYRLLERSVQVIYVKNVHIYELVAFRKELLVTERQKTVSRLKHRPLSLFNKRQQLSIEEKISFWAGIDRVNKWMIFFDGLRMKVHLYLLDKQAHHSYDLIWDRLKPASDKRGEPTKHETKRLRKILYREYAVLEINQRIPKLLNITLQKELGEKRRRYFATTSLPSFPLITMTCLKEDNTENYCYWDRQCYGETKNSFGQPHAIAFHREKKLLFLSYKKEQFIKIFKINSCFDVRYIKTIKTPPKMEKINDLFIDKNQLWILTEQPNNYFFDASIFFFPLSELRL